MKNVNLTERQFGIIKKMYMNSDTKFRNDFEINLLKSVFEYNKNKTITKTCTEKQFPYLLRIFKNNKYRFVDTYKTI